MAANCGFEEDRWHGSIMSTREWMDELRRDVRQAVRALITRPTYTLGALLSLSLGIGVNTLVYSAESAVMLRSLAYPDADRLAVAYEVRKSTHHGHVTPGSVARLTKQASTLASIGAYSNWPVPSALTVPGGAAQIVSGYATTPELFRTLKITPFMGRLFQPDDAESGRPHVVILREQMWRRSFGADPHIIGRSILLDNTPYTVIGVIRDRDAYPADAHDIWVPYPAAGMSENFESGNMQVVARLAPDVTMEQARAQVAAIGHQLSADHPNSWANARIELKGFRSDELLAMRPFALMLETAVVLVLLLACANTANLALGRVIGRESELAVRAALGAGRWRITRTLLTESMLLALLGGAIGILLATAGIPVLRERILSDYFARAIPGWMQIKMNGEVVLFTVIVSLATGVLFGVGPALHAARVDLTVPLKGGGRGSSVSASGARLRTVLVVTQFVLALTLAVDAVLVARSFVTLLQSNPGFQAEHILVLDIGIPKDPFVRDSATKLASAELVRRIQVLPGVQAAALTSFVPLGRNTNGTQFTVAGGATLADRDKPEAVEHSVTAGYFRTLGIHLLRGELWPSNTTGDSVRFVVVNKTLATHYLHGQDPIGAVLDMGRGSATIIGVVGDTKVGGLAETLPEPEIYEPMEMQAWRGFQLVAHIAGDPAAEMTAIRNQIAAVNPNIAVGVVRTMDDIVADYLSPWLLMAILIGGFAVIALVIAGVGIYGVVSYSVAQRTHEFGVRLALGAHAKDIIRPIIWQTITPLLLTLPLALLAAWLVARLLGALLYGVGATNPLTYGVVTVVLFAVAIIACIIPARHAASISPAESLRVE